MLDLSGYVIRDTMVRLPVFDTMVRLPVYEYDPTDDGLECEVITRILANHPYEPYEVHNEAQRIEKQLMIQAASLVIFETEWHNLNINQKQQVIDEVGAKLRKLRI